MALLDILKNKEGEQIKDSSDKKESKKVAKENISNTVKGQSASLIRKPYITEKATFLSEQGKYVFVVPSDANKNEIKKAIKDIYKVQVEKINKIKIKPKAIGYGKNKGFKKGFVKIVATVKKGQKIDILK